MNTPTTHSTRLLRRVGAAIARVLRGPDQCVQCGRGVDRLSAVRGAGGMLYCSDEHAGLDQEISGP